VPAFLGLSSYQGGKDSPSVLHTGDRYGDIWSYILRLTGNNKTSLLKQINPLVLALVDEVR